MPNGKGVNVSFILKELELIAPPLVLKQVCIGQFIEEELQRVSKHNSLRWTELLVSMCSRVVGHKRRIQTVN